MLRLRVTNPFLAVQCNDDKGTFYTVPVGSIIATGDDLFQPGLMHISLRGQELLAFARDIKEHSKAFALAVVDHGSEDESKASRPPNRQPGRHSGNSKR